MLDHLIAEGIKPDYKAEYILMRDIEINFLNSSRDNETGIIPEGSIVYFVMETMSSDNRHTGYDFVYNNKTYHTNYPWILALNTPENVIRIKKAKEFEKFRDSVDKAYSKLLNEVETLKIK